MNTKQISYLFQNAKEYKVPIRIGKTPTTLNGTYFKVGPGKFNSYDIPCKHPFDADGCISKFIFNNGYISYQSQYVKSKQYHIEKFFQKRIFQGTFGTPGWLPFLLKHPLNTNCVQLNDIDDVLLVLSDGAKPHLVHSKTLENITNINMIQKYKNLLDLSLGSHYRYDSDKQTYTFFSISYMPKINGTIKSRIVFVEVDKHCKKIFQTHIDICGFVYFHDFSMTKNYILFFHHPLSVNIKTLFKYQCLAESIQSETKPTDIYALSRIYHNNIHVLHTNDIWYSFHHIHAIETLDAIELFHIAYPKFFYTVSDFKDINKHGTLYSTNIRFHDSTLYTCINTQISYSCEFPIVHSNRIFMCSQTMRNIMMMDNCKEWKMIFEEKEDTYYSEPWIIDAYLFVISISFGDVYKKELVIYDIYNSKHIETLLLPDDVPIGLHGFAVKN